MTFAQGATTLRDVLAQFAERGYAASFAARDGGRLECLVCHQAESARDATMTALHRMEGVSDPADMLAVVALECGVCGARGTAVCNYGPQARPADADVLRALDDARQGPGVTP